MQERVDVIKQQLLEHLRQENHQGLNNLFEITHPSDLSAVMEVLGAEEARRVFARMPQAKRVDILGDLPPGRSVGLLGSLDDDAVVQLLQEVNPDDAADIFLLMEKDHQEDLLTRIEDDRFRRILIDLISYPAESAGGIMTTEYLAIQEDTTVEEAIDAARERSPEAEIVYYIFTLDEDNRLSGVLPMRRLIQEDPGTPVREITQRDLFKVRIDDDQEEAAQLMERYDLLAVPVVDHQDRMRGIITVDDAVDILEREATEDIFKQAGLSPFHEPQSDRNIRITRTSLWSNLGLRVPWLVVVFTGTLVTASSVSLFEPYLQKYVELAFFMPVIAAMGGNVGAQSTTIFVRSLALGHVDTRHFWRPLAAEILKTGLGIGLLFGVLLGVSTWSWQLYLRGHPPLGYALEFAVAVGGAMFLAILAASANGFLIPWLVSTFGADPAAASNPLLTTVQDLVGIVIYFSCAALFLGAV